MLSSKIIISKVELVIWGHIDYPRLHPSFGLRLCFNMSPILIVVAKKMSKTTTSSTMG